MSKRWRYVDGVLVEHTINGYPSAAKQVHNIFGAAGKAITNPTPVSSEERERRLAICHVCEFLVDGKRCLKCGCHVNWKSRLEVWHCPIEKW